MTQKDLLYLEDAFEHEDNLISICNYTISSLDDNDLKNFMEEQVKKHEKIKEKLMKVMEDIGNER